MSRAFLLTRERDVQRLLRRYEVIDFLDRLGDRELDAPGFDL